MCGSRKVRKPQASIREATPCACLTQFTLMPRPVSFSPLSPLFPLFHLFHLSSPHFMRSTIVKRIETWMVRLFFACTVAFEVPIKNLWQPQVLRIAGVLLAALVCKVRIFGLDASDKEEEPPPCPPEPSLQHTSDSSVSPSLPLPPPPFSSRQECWPSRFAWKSF